MFISYVIVRNVAKPIIMYVFCLLTSSGLPQNCMSMTSCLLLSHKVWIMRMSWSVIIFFVLLHKKKYPKRRARKTCNVPKRSRKNFGKKREQWCSISYIAQRMSVRGAQQLTNVSGWISFYLSCFSNRRKPLL